MWNVMKRSWELFNGMWNSMEFKAILQQLELSVTNHVLPTYEYMGHKLDTSKWTMRGIIPMTWIIDYSSFIYFLSLWILLWLMFGGCYYILGWNHTTCEPYIYLFLSFFLAIFTLWGPQILHGHIFTIFTWILLKFCDIGSLWWKS